MSKILFYKSRKTIFGCCNQSQHNISQSILRIKQSKIRTEKHAMMDKAFDGHRKISKKYSPI